MLSRILSGLSTSTLAIALAVFLITGSAHAASLGLASSTTELAPGDSVTLTLDMDFDETTVGGSFGVDFDSSVLRFLDISYILDPETNPNFTCPGALNCSDDAPNFLSFGGFPGYTGARAVAEIVFEVIAGAPAGETIVALSQRGNGFASNLGSPIEVDFGSVALTVIPEPSSALLIGLGMLFLGRRPGRVNA